MLQQRFSKEVPDWFWCMKCDLKTKEWERLMWRYNNCDTGNFCIDCSWKIYDFNSSSDIRRCYPCAFTYLEYDLESWLLKEDTQETRGTRGIKEMKQMLQLMLSYLHDGQIPFKNYPPVTFEDEDGTYYQFTGNYIANDGLSLVCPQCFWRKEHQEVQEIQQHIVSK